MASECILKSDGRVYVRPVEITVPGEREVFLDAAILATLTRGVSAKVRDCFRLPIQSNPQVGLCLYASGVVYASFRLPHIRIKSAIQIIGDRETVVPAFGNSGPVIDLVWLPTPDCAPVLTCKCEYKVSIKAWTCIQPYLWAFDRTNGKSVYHLPLPNLYSDCRICTGLGADGFTQGEDLAACLVNAATQFDQSKWNADLLRDNGDSGNTLELLKFKTVKDGFESIPCPDWRRISKQVGTTVLESVVI